MRTTNKDLTRFRAAAAAGLTLAEAARACGVSRWVVTYWARRCGLRFVGQRGMPKRRLPPPPPPPPPLVMQELVASLARLREHRNI